MNPALQAFWIKYRGNRRIRLKRRRSRQYIPRREKTARELVEFLQSKDIRTTWQLRKRREPTDPTVADYVKCFGRWSEAVRQAYGEPRPRATIPVSRDNILVSVLNLGIRTRSDYSRQRKQWSDILPSLNQVRRHFTSFGEMMEEAKKRSVDLMLGEYLSLYNKLNRTPSADECRQWKLDMRVLTRMFGGKRALDGFIATLP